MSEFIVNDDMFGLYARIPTGFSHERHIYKIIARIESNSYCDLPLGTCNTKQTRHGEIVPVLLVIHCGLDETEVVRIKEADCEIVNSHLREVAELTELLNASKAGQVSLQKAWEQDKADLTARAGAAEAERDAAVEDLKQHILWNGTACTYCRYCEEAESALSPCDTCEDIPDTKMPTNWEWRGLQAGKGETE